MEAVFEGGGVTVYHGDCLEVMRGLPDASVDAIVTDPPYGLGFMGKEWDDLPPGLDFGLEAVRLLKPGGYLLAFGGTRTWHRLAAAVEDAGFDIRDSIAWLHSEGFPKGGHLKPAFEPVVVARRPFRGSLVENLARYGTGALNIEGARVPTTDDLARTSGGWQRGGYVGGDPQKYDNTANVSAGGRWPANVVLDGDCAETLDAQRAEASRFFYVPKATSDERPTVGGVAHPTVKPLELMRWLVRLVTPPGGTVLEPFAGSGTTAEACLREGFGCIAIEREADYLPLILKRVQKDHAQSLFGEDW